MNFSAWGFISMILVVFIFITSLFNFVTIFPSEQGVDFSNSTEYLKMSTGTENISTSAYDSLVEKMDTGYNSWDAEVGFMGSNTLLKTKDNLNQSSASTLQRANFLVKTLFGSDTENPLNIIFGIIIKILAPALVILIAFAWFRSGR
jgi:hypothetical protein